jgi:hypothetical protein
VDDVGQGRCDGRGGGARGEPPASFIISCSTHRHGSATFAASAEIRVMSGMLSSKREGTAGKATSAAAGTALATVAKFETTVAARSAVPAGAYIANAAAIVHPSAVQAATLQNHRVAKMHSAYVLHMPLGAAAAVAAARAATATAALS